MTRRKRQTIPNDPRPVSNDWKPFTISHQINVVSTTFLNWTSYDVGGHINRDEMGGHMPEANYSDLEFKIYQIDVYERAPAQLRAIALQVFDWSLGYSVTPDTLRLVYNKTDDGGFASNAKLRYTSKGANRHTTHTGIAGLSLFHCYSPIGFDMQTTTYIRGVYRVTSVLSEAKATGHLAPVSPFPTHTWSVPDRHEITDQHYENIRISDNFSEPRFGSGDLGLP
jgi:hypothetical protein